MAISQLLRRRRFAPLFATQFLRALNDNLFKNALLVLATFHTAASAQHSAVLVNLAAGIFIAPFFLRSPLAGQLADKIERSRLIRTIKLAEIGVMLIGAAALTGAGLLAAGLDVTQLFLTVALMNVAVAVFIFARVPEFLLRLVVWGLVHSIYRIERDALENIPARGAALLVCNHVSFVDALLIAAVSPRPVRFVMDHRIYATPLLNLLFRASRAIPIAPAQQDARLLEQAYDAIAHALEQGELVCIFPHGRITHDGNIKAFKPGVERIVRRTPVPVIPLALRGLWGSYFSRHAGHAMRGVPRRLWSRLAVVSGEPVPPEQVRAADLQQLIEALRGEWR